VLEEGGAFLGIEGPVVGVGEAGSSTRLPRLDNSPALSSFFRWAAKRISPNRRKISTGMGPEYSCAFSPELA